jgi:hypothetical protein
MADTTIPGMQKTDTMNMPEKHNMNMPMGNMSHSFSLNLPMNRNGSGTAWSPECIADVWTHVPCNKLDVYVALQPIYSL